MNRAGFLIGFSVALVALGESSKAQSGGGYVIVRGVVGGGAESIAGGAYALGGSVGALTQNPLSGGGYALTGGVLRAAGQSTHHLTATDSMCYGGSYNGGSCAMNADCPGGVCGLKSRYLSIAPPTIAGGDSLSIQVTLVDVDDKLGLDDREGQVWWAGPSWMIDNAPNASLRGAAVWCEASPSHTEIWSGSMIHLYGPPIVPGSTYEIRMCDVSGANCSVPLMVATGQWGDAVAAFGGPSQPNFADITALMDKFRELVAAPDTPRADLVPDVPNQVTNFADISAGVDAFKGSSYPYMVPSCP